jgi:hypothetical protein
MMVDFSMSTLRPLGTGMSSNSLRWTRGDDAHAERARTATDNMNRRRMGSSSSRQSYKRVLSRSKLLGRRGW